MFLSRISVWSLLLVANCTVCLANPPEGSPGSPPAANGAVIQFDAESGPVDQYAHHYYVYYRTCAYSNWKLYRCYGCPADAQYAAGGLRSYGYATHIACR